MRDQLRAWAAEGGYPLTVDGLGNMVLRREGTEPGLPPVVIGYFLLLFFGRNGWGGAMLKAAGIDFIFTWKAAAVASATVGFPLLVRSIRLGMESIDRQLIQASRSLGASWHDTLFTIVLPLSLRGMVAGSSLMFARSLGEFGATITFVSNIPGETRTLPLAIYTLTQVPGGDAAAMRLSIIAIVLSVIALMLSEWLVRRSQRRARGHDD